MKWSWKIAQIAGIGVHVHATFLLLVGFYAITGWARNGNAMEGMQITVFILALFACIMFHELGHALTAKRFGIATRDITLLPIGGIARLERIPDEPRQELWIAAAGPIVSVMLATALYGVGWLGGNSLQVSLPLLNGALVQQLAAANLYLAVFNLIPAFPMDGGRILRALLAARLGRVRGTTIATRVGQAAAFLFGVAGLFFSPMLILIALFVWFSASQESADVQMRTVLDGLSVGQVMRSNVQVLVPSAHSAGQRHYRWEDYKGISLLLNEAAWSGW
jgi:Zn-dependent protease